MKAIKIYGIIGKVLLGCAGGIVGFVTTGISLALIGVVAGVVVGHVLENMFVRRVFVED